MSGHASTTASGPAGPAVVRGYDLPEANGHRLAPPLPEVIERLGFGRAQLKALVLVGGVGFADGVELLLISAVASTVAEEWHTTELQRGCLVTAVYLGIFLGNLASGPFGDNFGRRRLVLASYLGSATFSILSSIAPGVGALVAARLLVGVSIGIGQPAAFAIGSELTPAAWRITFTTALMAFFSMGEMYSASLIICGDSSMGSLRWRSLLRWGALPSAVLCVASLLLLHESPSFLSTRGADIEARAVLESIRGDNMASEVCLDFASAKADVELSTMPFMEVVRRQWEVVFGGSLLIATAIIMFSCFTLNLLYFGSLYAFPQVLPHVFGDAAASELFIGASWELVGYALSLLVGATMSQKRGIWLYLGLAMASLLAFAATAAAQQRTWSADAFTYIGYYGLKCSSTMGFVIVYQYAIELYPTEARITGTACVFAGGRVAAMLAPLLYELVLVHTHSFRIFFAGMALLSALNALLIGFLPHEATGLHLKDCEGREGPAAAAAGPSGYGATASGSRPSSPASGL